MSDLERVTVLMQGIEDDLGQFRAQIQSLEREFEQLIDSQPDQGGPFVQAANEGQEKLEMEQELSRVFERLQYTQGRLGALETQMREQELELRASSLARELSREQEGLERLKKRHAEEREAAEERLEDYRKALALARKQVQHLESELAQAEEQLEDLKTGYDYLVKEKSKRERELKDAKADVENKRHQLGLAEQEVQVQEDELNVAEQEVHDLGLRVERVRTLQNEHENAANYYRTQISHYGNESTSYVHLFDGGPADNLGLTSLLEVLASLFPETTQSSAVAAWHKTKRKIGIIAVDA